MNAPFFDRFVRWFHGSRCLRGWLLIWFCWTIWGETIALGGEGAAVWATHRGNSGSTGVSEDATVKPPLRMVWSYRCDSDTTGDAGAGLTVAGGKVFCNMIMTRSILALDAETGAFCWEFAHPDMHYQQTSSFADGRLFVWLRHYGRSTLVALDAATGKPVWEQKLASSKGLVARRSGPALAQGRVIVADADGLSAASIVAFDAVTGQQVWRVKLDDAAGNLVMAPSIVGDTIYTGTRAEFRRGDTSPHRGAAIALKLADGSLRWRNTEMVPTRPLVSDGKIVITKYNGEAGITKRDNRLSVLDARTGRELWSVPKWIIYGTTTITDKLVILKHYGATMEAYDRETGKQVWTSQFGGGSGCCSPSISGRYAYVGTGSFNDSEGAWAWRFTSPPHRNEAKGQAGICWSFHAIDLDTGKSAWHCTTGNNACGDPAIAYGRLYLNSRDGRIYCYEPVATTAEAEPNSPDTTPAAPPAEVRKLLAEKPPVVDWDRDWPMQAGDLDRTAAHLATLGDATEIPTEPTWSLETGGRIVNSPVASAGLVYVGSHSGKLLAADLASGRQRWEYQTGGPIQGSPAIAGGVIYSGSDDCHLHAVDAQTGKLLWKYATGGPVQSSPAVAGGVIFFGANDYHFYALDRHSGRQLWKFKTTHPLVIAAPVVHGETVYMAQWVDWLYALDASTGEPRWRDCVPISIESLHLYREKLYLRSARQIAEYDPATGRRLRLANAHYGYNGLAFLEDLVFTTGEGRASAMDLRDAGQPNRYQDQPAIKEVPEVRCKSIVGWSRLAAVGTPAVIGRQVFFASRGGELTLIEPDLEANPQARNIARQILWQGQLPATCHSSPIVVGGLLLIGADDGRLYAYGPTARR